MICKGLVGCLWGERRPEKRSLEVLGPGDWLGSECCRQGEEGCEARALTWISGWWVRAAEWFELVRRPWIQERFLQRQSERLYQLHSWQVVLAHGSVRARMAWQLLQLAGRFGESKPEGLFVPLYLTQEQQAELAGATRPRVWMAVKHFQDQGWLSWQADGFWIKDREALTKQSREC